MQVLFESIQPNRKWDESNPISVLQPNRRLIESILATKQIKGWSRPQNVGWSHSNPLIPQPNRRLEPSHQMEASNLGLVNKSLHINTDRRIFTAQGTKSYQLQSKPNISLETLPKICL
jgi:hypothetical protein